MQISIIIPVYNHWHLIPELISRLDLQTLGTDGFEVVLVDNGSLHVPDPATLPGYARLVSCPTPGSYAARNLGVREARGGLLVFTDADCRPEPDWLAQGATCAREAGAGERIVAGSVVLEPAETGTPNIYEQYDMALGMPQERYVRRGYGMTANLFVPRSVMDRVGAFDQGRFSGGDAEFCRRAGGHGVALHYCARAVVRHPARNSWAALAGKVRRIKGGQLASGSWTRRFLYAGHTFLPPMSHLLNILLCKRITPGQRLTVCLLQAGLWVVEMSEVVRLACRGEAVR